MPMPQNYVAKNWVMTVYTSASEADLRTLHKHATIKYRIVSNETCPDTQLAHWQCFLQFHKKLCFFQVIAIFGNTIHVKDMCSSTEEASDYCKKEVDFTEFVNLLKQYTLA